MSQSPTSFRTSVRGYDREEVDRKVSSLTRDLIHANQQVTESTAEIQRLTAELEEARAIIEEYKNPTYAGLGSKLENVLRTSEEESKRRLNEAKLEASRIIQEAEAEARNKLESIEPDLLEQRSKAESETEELLRHSANKAAEIIEEAQERAKAILDNASQDAKMKRSASSTESAQILSSAKREAAKIISEATKASSESKLMAELQAAEIVKEAISSEEVAKTSKASEAKLKLELERKRSDLEVELKARRAEADADYLAKHQEAIMQTQGYITEAEKQLAQMRNMLETTELQAKKLLSEARAEIRKQRAESDETNRRLLLDAEKRARKLLSETRARITEQEAESERKLEIMRNERDVIMQYFKNLKKVISKSEGFSSLLLTDTEAVMKSQTGMKKQKVTKGEGDDNNVAKH